MKHKLILNHRTKEKIEIWLQYGTLWLLIFDACILKDQLSEILTKTEITES